MKFDYTKNGKARYKIKIWYFCQINADELCYSSKEMAFTHWEELKKDPKDIQSAILINLNEQYIEKVFEREWN